MRNERLFSSVRDLADTRPEKAVKIAKTPEVAYRHQTALPQRFIHNRTIYLK